jgi:hypothetical protein
MRLDARYGVLKGDIMSLTYAGKLQVLLGRLYRDLQIERNEKPDHCSIMECRKPSNGMYCEECLVKKIKNIRRLLREEDAK